MYQVNNPINSAMGGQQQPAGQVYPTQPQTTDPNPGNAAMMGYQAYNMTPAVSGGSSAAAGGGTAGSVSGGGTAGVSSGWIAGLAAAIYADETMARDVAGTEDDPEAAWELNNRGVMRYGGMSPGQTALLEEHVGRDKLDKVFDPIGVNSKIEKPVAKVIAGTLPETFGGTGKYDPVGSKLEDYIFG